MHHGVLFIESVNSATVPTGGDARSGKKGLPQERSYEGGREWRSVHHVWALFRELNFFAFMYLSRIGGMWVP